MTKKKNSGNDFVSAYPIHESVLLGADLNWHDGQDQDDARDWPAVMDMRQRRMRKDIWPYWSTWPHFGEHTPRHLRQ